MVGSASKWKESLIARTVSRRNTNLMHLVYGQPGLKPDSAEEAQGSSESGDSEDDEFFKPKDSSEKVILLQRVYFFVKVGVHYSLENVRVNLIILPNKRNSVLDF